MVKSPPATWDPSSFLGWGDPLEEGMETHSSILAWRIPWTDEPGSLQYKRSQRVRRHWATQHSTHTHLHMHTWISDVHSKCQVVRVTWLRQKRWTHTSAYLPWDLRETRLAGTVSRCLAKLRAMLGKKLRIFQARRFLGSTPEAVVQSDESLRVLVENQTVKSDLWQGLLSQSKSPKQQPTAWPKDTEKPWWKWYRSHTGHQYLLNIQRVWPQVDPGAGPDNEAPHPPLAWKCTPTGPSLWTGAIFKEVVLRDWADVETFWIVKTSL